MKRPAVLIIGAAAGALLVAAVGASAHTGISVTKLAGVVSGVAGDEASAVRSEPTETPEAPETPKAQPTAEPSEAADTDTETNDDQETETTSDHETDGSGSSSSGGGGGEHGD